METRHHSFQEGKHGSALAVRVVPRSKKDGIAEIMDDGRIKIRLTAPPLDGKANQALIHFLSGILNVPESALEIVAGLKSRDKIVSIEGLDAATAEQRICQNLSV